VYLRFCCLSFSVNQVPPPTYHRTQIVFCFFGSGGEASRYVAINSMPCFLIHVCMRDVCLVNDGIRFTHHSCAAYQRLCRFDPYLISPVTTSIPNISSFSNLHTTPPHPRRLRPRNRMHSIMQRRRRPTRILQRPPLQILHPNLSTCRRASRRPVRVDREYDVEHETILR
jgi:hypothetical protein